MIPVSQGSCNSKIQKAVVSDGKGTIRTRISPQAIFVTCSNATQSRFTLCSWLSITTYLPSWSGSDNDILCSKEPVNRLATKLKRIAITLKRPKHINWTATPAWPIALPVYIALALTEEERKREGQGKRETNPDQLSSVRWDQCL
jgi:hypothetical protein